MDAVVIAGGRVPPALARIAGHSVKGLFQFGEATQIVRVLRALEQSGVERIAVVGSELLLHALPRLSVEMRFAVEGSDPVENLWRGVERLELSAQQQFLHCAVDLPMLTGEALGAFIASASPHADAVVGWTPEQAFVQAFPNAPYQALQFVEGRFISASVSILRVGFLESHLSLLRRLARARKSAPKVALTLVGAFRHHLITTGLPLTARFLTGRLALGQIEQLARRLLNARLQCVLDAPPELAYDVDDEADYRYAQMRLRAHACPTADAHYAS